MIRRGRRGCSHRRVLTIDWNCNKVLVVDLFILRTFPTSFAILRANLRLAGIIVSRREKECARELDQYGINSEF